MSTYICMQTCIFKLSHAHADTFRVGLEFCHHMYAGDVNVNLVIGSLSPQWFRTFRLESF